MKSSWTWELTELSGLMGVLAVVDLVRSGGRAIAVVLAVAAVVLAVAAVVHHCRRRAGFRTAVDSSSGYLAETFE